MVRTFLLFMLCFVSKYMNKNFLKTRKKGAAWKIPRNLEKR